MLVLPPTANAPLFQKLKPIKRGKRTVQKNGQPVERDIPEGAKRLPSGAYQLIFFREEQKPDGVVRRRLKSMDPAASHFRELNQSDEKRSKKYYNRLVDPQSDASIALQQACLDGLGRGTEMIHSSRSPVVELPRGDVFFSPASYRRLERRAAKEFSSKTSDPRIAAQVAQQDRDRAELEDKATVRPSKLINLEGTMGAIVESGLEQGRSPEAIVSGLERALDGAMTLSDNHLEGIESRILLGMTRTLEQKTLTDTLRAGAEKVLANPNRGKIYIKIEPNPRKGQPLDPGNHFFENPFRAVISNIVPPKKTKS